MGNQPDPPLVDLWPAHHARRLGTGLFGWLDGAVHVSMRPFCEGAAVSLVELLLYRSRDSTRLSDGLSGCGDLVGLV
jgi:hypothetical protein